MTSLQSKCSSLCSAKGMKSALLTRRVPSVRVRFLEPCRARAVLSTSSPTAIDEKEASVVVLPDAESVASIPTTPQDVETVVEQAEDVSPFQAFWRRYNELLDEKPILVKSLTSLVGFTLGDIVAQTIVGEPYSAIRTLHLTMFGVIVDGPCAHLWYTTLDKNIFPREPTSAKAIVAKTAMDQLIWGPCITCGFFTFIRIVEGHPGQIIPTIQAELIPTVLASYALWPLAHLINFRFIPSQQRILYINAVQIAWTAYLSNLAAHGHASLPHH
ncbi:hypothetical protein BSKO_08809 [Bryopsis sp. KO-2023]|nr:hypothetical protein BSKO_08809 [Bryopsis sp. KO-2023]